MKIAVMSDTHNALFSTRDVLGMIASEGVDTIIHCGDLSAAYFAEEFKNFCVYHAWGNCDTDIVGIPMAIRECKAGSRSEKWIKCVFDGKLIGAVHDRYSSEYRTMLTSGQFDYIFYGHTHVKSDEMVGKTRVVNPGAIGGAHRGTQGFIILDTETGEITDYVTE